MLCETMSEEITKLEKQLKKFISKRKVRKVDEELEREIIALEGSIEYKIKAWDHKAWWMLQLLNLSEQILTYSINDN